MLLRCSVCDEPLKAGDEKCRKCDEPQDVRSVFGHLRWKVGETLNDAANVRCPVCKKTTSLKPRYCLRCGCKFTIGQAIAPLLERPRKIWDQLVGNPTAETKQRFQIGYLIFSIGFFWAMLSFLKKYHGTGTDSSLILTFVFLVIILLFVFWLAPRRMLSIVARKTTRIVKVALAFNYFTALLTIQLATAAFKEEAESFGILCVISVIGFFVLAGFVWPIWVQMGQYFRESEDHQFDPSDFQGRRARTDRDEGIS